MEFIDRVRKTGNSKAIILPTVIFKALNLDVDDEIKVVVDNEKIIITKK